MLERVIRLFFISDFDTVDFKTLLRTIVRILVFQLIEFELSLVSKVAIVTN